MNNTRKICRYYLFERPLLSVIRVKVLIKESTSRPEAIFRWTTRDVKQVNKHKYCFSLFLPLPSTVKKGPPKSTAILVNALKEVSYLFKGNGAMIWLAFLAFLFLQIHSVYPIQLFSL